MLWIGSNTDKLRVALVYAHRLEAPRMSRSPVNVLKANDQAIAKVARTKVDKQAEFKIEGVPGLTLIITPGGAATFYYRYQVGKGSARKFRRAALGKYGQGGHGGLGIAAARQKALELATETEGGTDVVAETKAAAAKMTLRQLFELRREKDDVTAPRTLDDYAEVLARHVWKALGDKPADEITPDQFAHVLAKVEDETKHGCHKARSALGSTYRWAQRRRHIAVNPLAGLAFTHQSERRKRVLTDDELARLWTALDSDMPSVTLPLRQIIKLLVLTGQRVSEIAGIELAELKGLNAATPRLDIPARRMKRKSDDQFVPLVPAAVLLIKAAVPHANGRYLFPGATQGRRQGSDWRQEHVGQESVSRAFAKVAAAAKIKNVRAHDLRKCITSWLAEHGHASPEVLDAILHHGRRGVTGTHYNFALYEKQVRGALTIWAAHVCAGSRGSLGSGASETTEACSGGRIVPLPSASA
jgi:integrase